MSGDANPDPFRLRVMKAITAALKTITPANGYRHDLSDFEDGQDGPMARVYRGRDTFGRGDPLPMVSILEAPENLEGLSSDQSNKTSGPWRLLVQGFVADDAANPTDPAYHLEAEVRACLAKQRLLTDETGGPNILGLGYRQPSVDKLVIGQPVVRPPDGVNSAVANFWLPITLTLVEDLEKPFA